MPIAPAPYAAPAAYYFPRIPRMSAVEVSKGPAAIKYGPQTVAGAISMLSEPIPDATGRVGGKLDLLGGDFPGWITELHGPAAIYPLADRRGECIRSAFPRYRG